MNLLIAGILLWSLVHFFPAAMSKTRDNLIESLGTNRYRGLFSLCVAAALIMIIFGWKAAVPKALYAAPLAGGPLPSLLVLIAFVLFIAARTPTNIKRLLRHPQLSGVVAWGIAHLLTNGDSRSVTLFGGLAVWAIIAMLLSNRRDGHWQKPAAVAISSDAVTIAAGAISFGMLLYAHQFLFGVASIPH